MARRRGGRVQYEPNIRGLGKIMTGRGMEQMLRGKAQAGRQFAETVAPVDSGDYRSSFHVSSSSRGAGTRQGQFGSDWSDRAAAYVINGSDHALAVEFQNDARVLGRTVDAIENGP